MFFDLLLVIALLLLVSTIGRVVVRSLAQEEFSKMPVFWRLSTVSGIVLGIVTLLLTVAPEHRSLGSIFLADSRWAISLGELMWQTMSPLGLRADVYPENLARSPIGSALFYVGMPILLGLYSLASFRLIAIGQRKIRVMAAGVIWILVTAWLLNSMFSLMLWGIHHLNFWIFFAAIVFIRWPFVRLSFFRPGASTSEGAPRPR